MSWDHKKPRPFDTVERFQDFASELNTLCRKHGVELTGSVAIRDSCFSFYITANGETWTIQQ
jgi:hypothetical protein